MAGEYDLFVDVRSGYREGSGSWLQVALQNDADEVKDKGFCVNGLAASDNLTIQITPVV